MSFKYIVIRNAGEVDPEGFRLLGASNKREDSSKIGFFGSGIKYAISYLLRNKSPFTVFSGTNEVVFSTEKKNFRGEEFEQILVDGRETSITTSWGSLWGPWQIFREIVSNAIDEGGFEILGVNAILPLTGQTAVYLDYEEFKKYYENLGDYFLTDFDIEKELILVKGATSPLVVYKKGVRAIREDSSEDTSEKFLNSKFNYNLPRVDLSEERIADRWNVEYYAKSILCGTSDKGVIKAIYNLLLDPSNKDVFEYSILSNAVNTLYLSQTWLEVVEECDTVLASQQVVDYMVDLRGKDFIVDNNISAVPEVFYESLKKSFKEKFTKSIFKINNCTDSYLELPITKDQDKVINKLSKLLNKHGLPPKYPIKVVSFFKSEVKSQSTLGSDIILLSSTVFDGGHLSIMSLIIKEYLKLENRILDTESHSFREICLQLVASTFLKEGKGKQVKQEVLSNDEQI